MHRYVASLSSLVVRQHANILRQHLESTVKATRKEMRTSDQQLATLSHTHYDVLNGSTNTEQRARARQCVVHAGVAASH